MKFSFCRTCLNLEYDPFQCRTCDEGSNYENNGEEDDYDEDLRKLQALDKPDEEHPTIWLELDAA
jgi:hypothetical protein